jgi:hypothetical protein
MTKTTAQKHVATYSLIQCWITHATRYDLFPVIRNHRWYDMMYNVSTAYYGGRYGLPIMVGGESPRSNIQELASTFYSSFLLAGGLRPHTYTKQIPYLTFTTSHHLSRDIIPLLRHTHTKCDTTNTCLNWFELQQTQHNTQWRKEEKTISPYAFLHHRLTPPWTLADSSIENAYVPLYWYTLSYVPLRESSLPEEDGRVQ